MLTWLGLACPELTVCVAPRSKSVNAVCCSPAYGGQKTTHHGPTKTHQPELQGVCHFDGQHFQTSLTYDEANSGRYQLSAAGRVVMKLPCFSL